MPFLTATHINKSYQVGSQHLHVLRDLDLAIEAGEMVAVVGASGVGKSTLLHLLGGLDRADSGSIALGDTDIGGCRRRRLRRFATGTSGSCFSSITFFPNLRRSKMPKCRCASHG